MKADIVAAAWESLKLKNKAEDAEQALGEHKGVQFARIHSFMNIKKKYTEAESANVFMARSLSPASDPSNT